MTDNTDFAALYRELGIDAASTLDDVRRAWRRRVARLHPDQGGDAEDTGRLQELNRLYDAAVDFHARFGRLPGAPATAPGQASPLPLAPPGTGPGVRRTAGFGRISRWFVAASLAGIAVLGWRIAHSGDLDAVEDGAIPAADANSGAGERNPARVALDVLAVSPGMEKAKVRQILGDPLERHELRWSWGPSWVEFRCDRVTGWYSSPLRPLRVRDGLESYADPSPDNAPCD